MSYKSVWDFGREGKTNYSVHSIGQYPSKIKPIVFSIIVDRFTNIGDTILDPFCGCGTLAVEAKLQGRNSINYDINPKAVKLTRKKIKLLTKKEMISAYGELIEELKRNPSSILGSGYLNSKFKQSQVNKKINEFKKRIEKIKNDPTFLNTNHIIEIRDSRQLPLKDESVDAIITDIPYANMIKYSNLKDDLSNIDRYETFLSELSKALNEMIRVLKKRRYCVIFVADYRIGASRKILPIHSDIIQIMQRNGMILFDIYIWRYYRSGGFRPFGKKPFQAMNTHTYILVFYKPTQSDILNKRNKDIRYRKKLIQKISENKW